MSYLDPVRPPAISGHVRRVQRKRGVMWYVKYRAPDATAPGGVRQVNKLLGPEWPDGGPPPPGYFDRRTAQAALEAILTDARRGHMEVVRTGVSFERLAQEWLAWGEHERGWRHATLVDRRCCVRLHLVPAFGHLRVEQVTTARIERWKSDYLVRTGKRRQAAKLVALLHSMYERARLLYGIQRNPVADVERIRLRYDPAGFDFYSPEEVWALVRAAADEQDGAIFLTAAFAGLRRGELCALRWRDVDFAKRAIRVETSVVGGVADATKGGRGRAVPMVREVAEALARLGQRGYLLDRDDPVFPGDGGWLDGSALRRRFVAACERAELRVLRFHDLRHTFGSNAINRASVVQVQAWMGHVDSRTTMRYLHHKSLDAEADLLTGAFAVDSASEAEQLLLSATEDDGNDHHSVSDDQDRVGRWRRSR